MNQPSRVCLVDHDPALRHMLGSYLQQQGLSVDTLATAEELFARMRQHPPDVIVLDVMLPGLSGLEACRRLRGNGERVPIIFLTARSDVVDRVLGLELGADDFLGKPFLPREVLARIRAVLRRAPAARSPAPEHEHDHVVAMGDCRFDTAARALRQADGSERALGASEFAILRELASRPGACVTRGQLMAAADRDRPGGNERLVDMAIRRLRLMIERDPEAPALIRTVRGHGYRFEPAPQSVPAPALEATG